MTTISPVQEIPRDGWGRPLVTPPGGGKPVGYTRCTTYVGVLEDHFNLGRWQQRMTAIGLADSPELMLQLAAVDRDNKAALNTIVADAMKAAKSDAAATIGTALHALTERMDRGQDVGHVPEAYVKDLIAYEAATKDLTAVHIEQFSVNDDLKIGGTPDRVVEYDGRLMIADLKTGSVEWGLGKIAMQLAVYAHSVIYDFATGERTPIEGLDQDTAIVIHLPAGGGRAELLEVDIAAGWEGVAIATEVKAWRKRRSLSRPLVARAPAAPELQSPGVTESASYATAVMPSPPVDEALAEAVASAPNGDALVAIWTANQLVWTDDLTALAKARAALLDGGVLKP